MCGWIKVTLVLALLGAWSGATGTTAPGIAHAEPHGDSVELWQPFPLSPAESPTPAPASGDTGSPTATATVGDRPASSTARGEVRRAGSNLAPTLIMAFGVGAVLMLAVMGLTPGLLRGGRVAATIASRRARARRVVQDREAGSRPAVAPGQRPRRLERSPARPAAAAAAARTPRERPARARPASARAAATQPNAKKRAAPRAPSRRRTAAAVPVRCEIVCRKNSSRSRFEAIGFTADDSPAWLAESPAFRVGPGRPVERSGAALSAYQRLVGHLTRRGWEPDGSGEAWYEARFRRKQANA